MTWSWSAYIALTILKFILQKVIYNSVVKMTLNCISLKHLNLRLQHP
jgi:hypothetical protein